MNDIFGHTYWKVLAHYDQNGSCWKMSEDILASDLKKFSKTLPQSGITQDGVLYEQVMSERRTKGQDYSLLPTPLTTDNQKGSQADLRRQTPGLRAMPLLLTPTASVGEAHHQIKLLPTPTVMHVRNHNESQEAYESRVKDYEQGKTKGKPGKSTGVALKWYEKQYRIYWLEID